MSVFISIFNAEVPYCDSNNVLKCTNNLLPEVDDTHYILYCIISWPITHKVLVKNAAIKELFC